MFGCVVLRRSFLLVAGVGALAVACHRDASPTPEDVSPQQKIVERAALAVDRMRASGQFPALDALLKRCRGVMVFPRLVKAGLIFGGEGGNGVLLSRDASGRLSAPAFYSLGAGSLGAQIGYQEATVLLFFMTDAALLSAINRGLTLGADTALAAGTLGSSGEAASTNTGRDIYQLVDVGGLFAGASLDGTVVGAREEFNRAYYGPDATTYRIVVERRFATPGSSRLEAALTPR